MTCALMSLFLILYAVAALAGIKYQADRTNFFDLQDTTMLKGLFCIIVVLVHVPEMYQNRLQDMIGSFAYIGVTFFFMTSSYGLKWGLRHKEGYLQKFWLKRLPPLLVPVILCNLVQIVLEIAFGKPVSIMLLISIDSWVEVLLLFYFVFWLAYWLPNKLGKGKICRPVWGGYGQDAVICFIIVLFSLIDRLTPFKLTLIWPTESIGFVYGIILADEADAIQRWTNDKWEMKSLFFILLGGITGLAYLKFKPVAFWGDYCLKIFLGFVLLMLLLQLIRHLKIGNAVVSFLGGISYEIYLLHGSIFNVLAKTGITGNSGIYIWSVLIITIISAAIVKETSRFILKIVEKWLFRSK